MNIKFLKRYNKASKDEYLVFKVVEDCNLHQYIIYDSTFDGNGELSNLLPHMYRFPSQKVSKGSYVFLYIHELGSRKAFEIDKDGDNRYRFAWGLSDEMKVFNQEGDYLHIAVVSETKVQLIDGE